MNSGYAPTLSARRDGQVWLFSSANEESTPLFPGFRSSAGRDGWLLLEWSADPGADPADPDVWQSATPVQIDGTRSALMGDELASSLSTFRFERLNVWPDTAGAVWLPEGMVAAAGRGVVSPAVLVAAVEVARDQVSWSCAAGDGFTFRTLVGVPREVAVEWLRGLGAPIVLAHQAVVNLLPGDVAGEVRSVRTHEVAAASAELGDAVRAGAVAWDNAQPVAEQFGNVVLAQVDGLRRIVDARSRGDVSVVKALSWALWWARQNAVEPSMVF